MICARLSYGRWPLTYGTDRAGRGLRVCLDAGHDDDRVLAAASIECAVLVPGCLIIAAVPGMTTTVAPFLLVYGVSYFFTEFGPNMTTFVMPSEPYPVAMRATGHGISAGIGKLGAFIGVFLFPVLSSSFGLRGTLLLTAGVSVLRMALTFVLARAGPPQPGRHARRLAGHGLPAAARGRPGIVPVRT
jgi:MFS transporter, PHS family, inorganic phosphate transporter